MSYDILLFDADRTLFDFDLSEKIAFYEICPLFNVTPSDMTHALYQKINVANWEALERGEFSKERILVRRFDQFLSAVGVSGDAALMNTTYLNALSRQSILFDFAVPMLKRLNAANKRCFIVTNGVTLVQEGRIINSPVHDLVERVFISEQLGVAKPHKQFFDKVASMIESYSPDKAIVIGDSPTSDILGANNANIASVWLNPEGRTLPHGITATYEAKSLEEVLSIILSDNDK